MLYIINLKPEFKINTTLTVITKARDIRDNKKYLIVYDGHDDLNDEKIRVLYKDFKNTKACIMSPLVICDNKLEYFGSYTYYINEEIIPLNKVDTNNSAFQYVQNTYAPYQNIYLIHNKNNLIQNIFEHNDFLRYAEVLKNVSVNPFVHVRVKNHVEIDLKMNDIPVLLDKKYLKNIYNTYNLFGLTSFKFFNHVYYLNNSDKKTILMIETSIITPDKDCGSLYIYYLVKTLLCLNYNVHFITKNMYYNKHYTSILQRMGVCVIYGYHNSVENHIYKNNNVYSHVFICRLENMYEYFDFVKKNCKSKIIFITHDIQFLRNEENIMNKKMELKQLKNADCSVVVSKYEKEILNSDNVKYIPICYEIRNNYVRRVENTKDVYFIGSNHPPNFDGLQYFLNTFWVEIQNKINITLHVIGSGYDKLFNFKNHNVIFHGYVPDEQLKEIIVDCRLNIVPLRMGAGIKGKILQSLNFKIPTLTTFKGMEGMEVEHFKNIIMLNLDDENYVDKFISFYNDITLLTNISEEGYKTMKKFYSLEQNEKYFKEILTNM